MVFVESLSPILFACCDDEKNLYICSCHCQNAQKCEWLITSTTYRRLIDLLTDKLSIRDIFLNDGSTVYVATMYANDAPITVVEKKTYEVDSILPTAGFYMDADPDEFSEELAILEAEISDVADFLKVSFSESFSTFFNCFSIQVSIPDSITIVHPTGYLSSDYQLNFAIG